MQTIITPENWKEYKGSEAKRLFSIDMDVQYTLGWTRFDDDNFGKVTKITPAGIVYVATMKLDEVDRDCDQGGGWIEYDPKTATLKDEILRFLPQLGQTRKDGYNINWRGKYDSGRWDLRELEVGKNGRVRATIDSIL